MTLKPYLVPTIGHVSVGVVGLGEQRVLVQHREPVDDVGAQAVVDILGVELAAAGLAVGRPVGEVTHNLVVARQPVVQGPSDQRGSKYR